MSTELSAENQIQMFFHCRRCVQSLPVGMIPREYMSLEVGWTVQGIQVWCVRHDLNIVHIDFEGHTHPANLESGL